MTGDEDHAVAHQFASQRHRLIGVAEIVADDELDALPEDAARGVEIRDRHLGGAFELLAAPRLRAGHRAGHANQDVRPRGPAERGEKRDNGYGGQAAHDCTSVLWRSTPRLAPAAYSCRRPARRPTATGQSP